MRSTGRRSDNSRRRMPASGTRRVDPEPSRSTEMGSFDDLLRFLLASSEVWASRRRVLLAPLLAVPLALAGTAAQAGRMDPSQTVITLPDAIKGSRGADFRRTAVRWRRST